MTENRKLFALLIDGDNAQPDLIPQILESVEKYGEIVVKRVYGDWSNNSLKSWKPIVDRYLITMRHQFHGSTNKNATDIALVIDAMDLLWKGRGKLAGFCIVSSDSDFTHLATRIRFDKLMVIGVGKQDTPFKQSCDEFISTESLQKPKTDVPSVSSPKPAPTIKSASVAKPVKAKPAPTPKSAPAPKPAKVKSGSNPKPTPAPNSVKAKLVPKAKPASAPTPMKAEQLTTPDLSSLFTKAYQQASIKGSDVNGWVPMHEVTEIMFNLQSSYPIKIADSPRALAEQLKTLSASQPGIEIVTQPDGKPIVRYLRMKEHELDKFRKAYDHVNALKYRDKEGWVDLPVIRDMLGKLYPQYQPLIYRGTKYSQMKKVVQQMTKDYPGSIEFKTSGLVAKLRMKK